MTPTLTSPGQLSARACSSSGKSIRWSVRCTNISTQSPTLSWVLSRSLQTWSTKTLLGPDPTPHMCFRPYQDSPPPPQTPSMTQLLSPALAPDTHHQPSLHPCLPRSTITKPTVGIHLTAFHACLALSSNLSVSEMSSDCSQGSPTVFFSSQGNWVQ